LQISTDVLSKTSVIWQNLSTNFEKKKWKWEEEHQKVFEELKDKITS